LGGVRRRGSALGYHELRSIQSDQKLRDPILRLCWYLQRRFGPVGFLVNAMLIGCSPGAAIALKKVNHPRRVLLTFMAAILFATVWGTTQMLYALLVSDQVLRWRERRWS